MTGTVTHRCPCSCVPPLVRWGDLAFARSGSRRRCVGKTGEEASSCCCYDHQECDDFRKKQWCRRLVVLSILSVDHIGQSPGASALKSAVKDSLTARSCLKYELDFLDADSRTRGTELRVHSVLIFLLAEGELPVTTEQVQSWNDCVATVGAVKSEDCYVEVAPSTCCGSSVYACLCELGDMYDTWGAHDLSGRFLEELFEATRSFSLSASVVQEEDVGDPLSQNGVRNTLT